MKRGLLAVALLFLLISSADAEITLFKDFLPESTGEQELPPNTDIAVFRGVDKITARVRDLNAPIGHTVRFGTLEITVRKCHKTPPEEPPEVTAFVQVTDLKTQGQPEQVFSGWMFASSPALSALEHPVYDIWVIDCIARAPETEDGNA